MSVKKNYVAKVMAVHNKRLDDEKIKKALKLVFHERATTMIMTIKAFSPRFHTVSPKAEPKVRRCLPKVQKHLSANTSKGITAIPQSPRRTHKSRKNFPARAMRHTTAYTTAYNGKRLTGKKSPV